MIEQDVHNKELEEILQLKQEFKKDNLVSPLGLVLAANAAPLIGVKSVNTVYSLLDQHLIPEVRINSLRYMHIDDIINYVNEQRQRNRIGGDKK